MLVRLDALINWGSNSFKPKKSRSLSIRKGKLDEDVCFKVTSQDMQTFSQEPVKFFVRWYHLTLKNTKLGFEALEHASIDLEARDKCSFPGKYKL
ncbi:reverse transcriptase [Plakobranchus ocellatus]|uniref:Reverse transcriptase n=1 Tax=Plakobranchus ocellatus TaxID=259542 RepID=A0AAV4BX69_9GAST|nr:reverse transcriptase [Plakobranchus ocellatus]